MEATTKLQTTKDGKVFIDKDKCQAYEFFNLPMSRGFKKRWLKKGRFMQDFRGLHCIANIIGFDGKIIATVKSEKKIDDILIDGGIVSDINFDKMLIEEATGTEGILVSFVYTVKYE